MISGSDSFTKDDDDVNDDIDYDDDERDDEIDDDDIIIS